MAAKDKDLLHVVWEVTDVWFHTMVLLAHFGLSVDDVLAEFRRREGVSGIDEKKREPPAEEGIQQCMIACSAASSAARSLPQKSMKTTRCWPSATSSPSGRCMCW
jgi:hypothetical protein